MRRRLRALGFGSWLDPAGQEQLSIGGEKLSGQVRREMLVAILIANAVGFGVVVCFAVWALPRPPGTGETDAATVNVAVGVGYVILALLVGAVWGRHLLQAGEDGIGAWLPADREPTPAQRRVVLQGPLRIMFVQVVLWGLATVLFTVLNLSYSGLLALGSV